MATSKIKELKNKFVFEPGPYLVRKEKIILSQVACNYYKNIKSMRLKWKSRKWRKMVKFGKCERLTHFTLSLCQLWYCMIKISSHFNPPKFQKNFAKIYNFHRNSQHFHPKCSILITNSPSLSLKWLIEL